MFVKKCTLFLGIFVVLIASLAPATNSARAATAAQANGVKPNMGKAQQALPAQAIPTDQIIIKYKTNSVAKASPNETAQMQRLNNAAGTTLTYVRAMSGDANVLRLTERLPLDQVQTVAKKLMALPEVDYAEPDQIALPFLTPNDTYYADQWDLFGTYGINAPAAWDITTGSSSIVIADIDTGITNHVDLSGRTVAGYDFISDSQVANDGDGRDSDPSDPGDWITAAESSSGYFAGCHMENSSWHGTHTAGTIGAVGNNSTGIAGINWVSKILPVRVLGKCGGYTSDIVDGMRWSAGLSVTGVPANTRPARVLSLSLGGSGACPTTSQTAIDEITAAGAVVVVASGNSSADASGYNPGNCNGVITVAATDISGNLAYYSNYGSTIEISAPGGAQSAANDPNGILSTLNTGTTSPVADTYIYYQGTSMATPHVSGVVSLMLSVNPSLTPAQVLLALQSSARAFPGGSSCNTSICGSGMLDAGAAVNAALLSPGSFIKSTPANGATGQPASLTLSWGASSNATSYEYCINSNSHITCDASFVSTGTNTSIHLSGLALGTHSWQVHAKNGSGTTDANGGTWWSFTVVPTQSIYLPLVLKPIPLPGSFNKTGPTNGAPNQPANPTLSWGASSTATSYDYCYDTTNNSACDSSWNTTGASTSVPLSGLTPSTIYYWQVRANNAGGSTYADGGTWWSFTTAAPAAAWTTILSENFEGSFPGVWQLYDTSSSGYTWGKRSCRAFAGSNSGWGVGGGANGSSLSCGSNYPNNVNTYMVYGPFSLTDATAADLSYQLWLNSESNYDKVCAFASIDNNNFYGYCNWGNSGGWVSDSLDLSNVYTLGNLMGHPNVWIALRFYSNSSINYSEGGYVDNIVLRKCTAALCTGGTAATNLNNGRLIMVPSIEKIPK